LKYLSESENNIEKMKGSLLAHKYLKLFKQYPERDFPYPDEIKDPHPSRPYNPKKKKKAGSSFI